MMANVQISTQSLLQGEEGDGEMIEASPTPEAHQGVMGQASPTLKYSKTYLQE